MVVEAAEAVAPVAVEASVVVEAVATVVVEAAEAVIVAAVVEAAEAVTAIVVAAAVVVVVVAVAVAAAAADATENRFGGSPHENKASQGASPGWFSFWFLRVVQRTEKLELAFMVGPSNFGNAWPCTASRTQGISPASRRFAGALALTPITLPEPATPKL